MLVHSAMEIVWRRRTRGIQYLLGRSWRNGLGGEYIITHDHLGTHHHVGILKIHQSFTVSLHTSECLYYTFVSEVERMKTEHWFLRYLKCPPSTDSCRKSPDACRIGVLNVTHARPTTLDADAVCCGLFSMLSPVPRRTAFVSRAKPLASPPNSRLALSFPCNRYLSSNRTKDLPLVVPLSSWLKTHGSPKTVG